MERHLQRVAVGCAPITGESRLSTRHCHSVSGYHHQLFVLFWSAAVLKRRCVWADALLQTRTALLLVVFSAWAVCFGKGALQQCLHPRVEPRGLPLRRAAD